MPQRKNVLSGPLGSCSNAPKTGFYRNGCCDTGEEDVGRHTVCIVATEEFLSFSKAAGNDLSTPMPQFGFPGVKTGDRWCLCVLRWKEALAKGKAPGVVLEATHEEALKYVELEDLLRHAVSKSVC